MRLVRATNCYAPLCEDRLVATKAERPVRRQKETYSSSREGPRASSEEPRASREGPRASRDGPSSFRDAMAGPKSLKSLGLAAGPAPGEGAPSRPNALSSASTAPRVGGSAFCTNHYRHCHMSRYSIF